MELEQFKLRQAKMRQLLKEDEFKFFLRLWFVTLRIIHHERRITHHTKVLRKLVDIDQELINDLKVHDFAKDLNKVP